MSRPQRALNCLPCRQRKLRCDHGSPCANCIKSRLECLPASVARRERKRRLPERVLLQHLRDYEQLLAQNNIPFEPLHPHHLDDVPRSSTKRSGGGQEIATASPASQTGAFESKNVWHTMSQGFRGSENSDSSEDEVRASTIKREWEEFSDDSDHLLFSLPRGAVDLGSLHPSPARIFKLWQAYLDNVNPLLKVTHTPSIQGRIVEAASNTEDIDPPLEALMFAIYCTSLLSLPDDECLRIFGTSKRELLVRYQLGCQQALWNCKFLRSNSRDCLTALFLYLVSIRPNTAPQSLSCMLGVAMRIAQRIAIHSETALARLNPFDGELSRRLWWALALFDTRISGIAGVNPVALDPTWDCRIPLSVNDSEIWEQMKEFPVTPQSWRPTETCFVSVRSVVADFLRRSDVHLDFTNPILKAIPRPGSPAVGQSEVSQLEEIVESRYLKFCDEGNPLHYMTIWSTRAFLAKFLLLECQSKGLGSSKDSTESQRDMTTSLAIRTLECDTLVMTCPMTKRFIWLNHAYFPFPAYIQIAQDLRLRPRQEQASRAWQAMSDSFDAWSDQLQDNGPVTRIFTKLILSAWESCARASTLVGERFPPPKIVEAASQMQKSTSHARTSSSSPVRETSTSTRNTRTTSLESIDTPRDLQWYGLPSIAPQSGQEIPQLDTELGVFEQDLQMDWNMLDAWPGWSGR